MSLIRGFSEVLSIKIIQRGSRGHIFHKFRKFQEFFKYFHIFQLIFIYVIYLKTDLKLLAFVTLAVLETTSKCLDFF